MKTRNFVLCALGLAAAITFGGAATASAQARSDRSIPVRKDMPAEVRVDTIRLPGRVDTVMVRGRTDTVRMTVDRMRYDTVMQMLPLQRLPGLYFGLGGGLAIPMNNWRNTTKDGFGLQAQAGYFPMNGTIGIRGDVNYSWLNKRETDCKPCADPRILAGSLDLVARFPLDQRSKLNPVVYILGGGGVDKIFDFIAYRNTDNKVVTAGESTQLSSATLYPSLGVTSANRGTKSLFFHYEGGAGLDVSLGGLHTFVETKYSTLNTINGRSHYWPTIIGIKFY